MHINPSFQIGIVYCGSNHINDSATTIVTIDGANSNKYSMAKHGGSLLNLTLNCDSINWNDKTLPRVPIRHTQCFV